MIGIAWKDNLLYLEKYLWKKLYVHIYTHTSMLLGQVYFLVELTFLCETFRKQIA